MVTFWMLGALRIRIQSVFLTLYLIVNIHVPKRLVKETFKADFTLSRNNEIVIEDRNTQIYCLDTSNHSSEIHFPFVCKIIKVNIKKLIFKTVQIAFFSNFF